MTIRDASEQTQKIFMVSKLPFIAGLVPVPPDAQAPGKPPYRLIYYTSKSFKFKDLFEFFNSLSIEEAKPKPE